MTQGPNRASRSAICSALMLAGIIAGMPAGHAMELTEPGSDIRINWDNTLRYRLAARVGDQQDRQLHHPNFDDGNRNFDTGIVSNRLELLTELDVISRSKGIGFRVSGQGWYDAEYNQRNDNPGFAGGAVPNHTSQDYDEFTRTTQRREGRDFQLRDAFAFAKFSAGDMPATLRLGKHALVWGESLFFAANGIAGAQSPFDITRLLADPTAQAKEFVLPVNQVSGQIQLTPDVTIGAYYQFDWVRNTFPSVGSFLSQSDIFGYGAENMWVGPGMAVARGDDLRPKDNGQGGVQIRWNALDTDFGLYALRFHDKTAQIVTRLGMFNPAPGVFHAAPTGYYQAFHQGTTVYGFSASHTFGPANVAVEASIRNNQALASSGGAVDTSSFTGAEYNVSNKPAYAVGKTAHVNASVLWSLEPGALWREAILVGEVAWNRMLKCDKNCDAALDPQGTRDAIGMRGVFTPTYRQVLPGLDLSVPVGIGYTPKGSRSLALGPGYLPPENGGDITIGLAGVYQSEWHFNLAYTHFYGRGDTLMTLSQSPVYTYDQVYKDRDFLTFTVRKTF